MNLVDLTLVIFVALTVFVGIKRGFLISLLSALRFIIAIPLSLFVGNNYNVIIYNKVVRRYILEYVSKKLNDSGEITKFTENVKSFANTFSFFVKDNSTVKSLSNINSNEAAVYITDNILCPIVQEIIKILLILLTFVLFYVITNIILSFAKKIRKEKELPFHKTNTFLVKTNSFFGGVFGLVKSGAYLIVISAICEFVLDIMTTQNQFVTQLRSSVIIEYINKFNPLI